MNLKEIRERKAEIKKRLQAINEIATRAAKGEKVEEKIESTYRADSPTNSTHCSLRFLLRRISHRISYRR